MSTYLKAVRQFTLLLFTITLNAGNFPNSFLSFESDKESYVAKTRFHLEAK